LLALSNSDAPNNDGACFNSKTWFGVLRLEHRVNDNVSACILKLQQQYSCTKRDGAVHEAALHHYFALLFAQTSSERSSENEVNVNDTTNNLLERARKLRQEIFTLESDKIQSQKQRNDELQVVETEKQIQKDDLRTRYTVIVPILKDMGEEVMERVSFSPIFKGGKIHHLMYFALF
jgi:hypothetical protein